MKQGDEKKDEEKTAEDGKSEAGNKTSSDDLKVCQAVRAYRSGWALQQQWLVPDIIITDNLFARCN